MRCGLCAGRDFGGAGGDFPASSAHFGRFCPVPASNLPSIFLSPLLLLLASLVQLKKGGEMSENRGVLGPWDSSRATLGGDIGDTPPALRAFPSPPQFPPISLPAVGNPRGRRTLGNAEIPFFRGVLSLKNKIRTLRENFIFKGNSFILFYFIFCFRRNRPSPFSETPRGGSSSPTCLSLQKQGYSLKTQPGYHGIFNAPNFSARFGAKKKKKNPKVSGRHPKKKKKSKRQK